jgi:hypothetical protein
MTIKIFNFNELHKLNYEETINFLNRSFSSVFKNNIDRIEKTKTKVIAFDSKQNKTTICENK